MEALFFILEQVYRMTHIPINCMDRSGSVTLFIRGYEATDNPFLCDNSLLQFLITCMNTSNAPILEYEEDIIYGLCKDSLGNYIILGPVTGKKTSTIQVHHYAHKHSISSSTFQLKSKPINKLIAALSTIFYNVSGKYLSEVDLMTGASSSDAKDNNHTVSYQEYMFESHESDTSRYNFSVEMDFVNQIKNGDIESAKKHMQYNVASFHEESVGKLAERSFKQNEYMTCSAIILASRAAIDGGIDSMTSYLMSDVFLQRLEKCKNIKDIYKLLPEVIFSYAECVHQYKEQHSKRSYVEQCKNYITKHLNKAFTVDDIANEIGINKSYLSRQFSKSEGIGILQYTHLQRIRAAENMLRFSDESILTISNYLCFSSQSHFGSVFRQHTATTPQKYRDKHKLIDFV